MKGFFKKIMKPINKKKVVIVGNTGVGKTSIIHSYLNLNSIIKETVGASSFNLSIEVQDKIIDFIFWDTAGQENFKCLVPIYARGSHLALITFSYLDNSSFESIPKWLNYLKSDIGIKNFFIIGNMSDLDEKQNYQSSIDYCSNENIPFFSVSAKNNENINLLFYSIAKKLIEIENEHNYSITEEFNDSKLIKFEKEVQKSTCC